MTDDDEFKNITISSYQNITISSYQFFHADRMDVNIFLLKAFAEQQGVPVGMVYKFIDYNLFHCINGHLCDKQGNLIGNVYGAFLRFAKSGYDRARWEDEHGINGGVKATNFNDG